MKIGLGKMFGDFARSGRMAVAAVVSLGLVAGCTTMDNGYTSGFPKVSNTVAQACLAGMAIGGLSKLITQDGADLEDVLDGALVGGIAGCALGAVLDNRRQKFASTADYYDSEIARTRNLNNEMLAVNNRLDQSIAENRTQLAKLRTAKANATLDKEAAEALRSKSRAELAWATKQKENAEKELIAQENVLAAAEKESAGSQQTEQLRSEVAQLKTKVSSLDSEITELASVTDSIGQFAAS